MTIHAPELARTPLPAGLDEAAELARELHAALARCLERERPLTADPAAASLDRLLRGAATPTDRAVFDQRGAGGRLVIALLSGKRSADQLLRALNVGVNVVVLAVAPDEVAAFVPELPRRVQGGDRRTRAYVVASEMSRHDPTAAVAISSAISAAHQLPTAWKDCMDAARLAAPAERPIVFADASWADIALARVSTALPQWLTIDNPLTRLISYDAAKGTAFAETVHAWLQRNCDTAAAAAALSVHPNTLRYRLKRANQLSGLDLDDAHTRAIALLVLGVVIGNHSSARRGISVSS